MQFPTLMTRQGQYLMIKQKLDSYNLSTTFPLQMMPLLQKLLTRLDQQVERNNSIASLSLNKQNTPFSQTKQFQLAYKHVDKAIKSQISKVVQQNNQLHLQIIALKQELQSWRHCIDKELIEKSDNKEEMKRIVEFRNERQRHLMEQVQVAKFRYNELIDFIHEQDNLERMYIKRLYNHKKYQLDQGKLMANTKQEDLNSRITFKAHNPNSSSRQKQSRKRINKTIDGHNASSVSHHSHRFQLIEQKLKNREKQIQRLHAIISHDGVNLNRVLHSFNEEQQKSKYLQSQQRITYLEQEKHKLQKDLQKSVKTGGRYQALKQEVVKLQQLTKKLKEENKLLKRAKEQSDFDIVKQKKSINREMSLNNVKNVEMKVVHFNDYLTIEELRKKVDFYQKQLGIRVKQEKQLAKSDGKNKSKKNVTNALNKSVKVSKDAKVSKDKVKKSSSEQIRQKYEDEIKLNQKAEKKSTKKQAVSAKVPALNQKSKISRIPQESEEQSSQKDQLQNQQDTSKNQQKQNDNNDSDQEQSNSQQQQAQSSSQGKNQTLIEQYQETINELTSKCTRQKEQIDLKNNAIVGLQQIATRLIKQDEQRHNQQFKIDNTEQSLKQLSTLKHQVQSLSALLNESEFQKQELRRELIQLQALYKKISQKEQREIVSQHELNQQAFNQAQELKQNLQLKDKKIQEMRQLKIQIEDRLLHALDRIKRLNDQIQLLTKDNQYLHAQLNSKDEALLSTINLLKEQKQRHSGTIQLSQIQKDEIIMLRKNLIDAQNIITNLQTKITQLQSYIVLLEEENQTLKSNRPKPSFEFQ